jgi:hypothetical protein
MNFGGDAAIGENVTWVSLKEHAQLVRWWNDLYHSVKNRSEATPEGYIRLESNLAV